MKRKLALVGAVLAALLLRGVAYGADDVSARMDTLQRRIDALELKNEQLERSSRQALGATEADIERVVERFSKSKEKPTDFKVYWKDGLRFDSRDGLFKLQIGGRLYLDGFWADEGSDTRAHAIPATGKSVGDQLDGVEARTLRLSFAGTLYGNTDYKVELDFAGTEKAVQKSVDEAGDATKSATSFGSSTVAFKDVYLGFKDILPIGYLKVGHFKEPFSLEELTSSRYVTFMERSLPTGAFSPSRNVGVQLSSAELGDRMTWAVGMFRDTDNRGYGQSEGGGWNATARLTGLPWYEEDGRRLLHVGAAASLRNPDASVQYKSRPEMHLAATYLDTGSILTDDVMLLGGEAALVLGPFSLQAECMRAMVDPDTGSDLNFQGAYVQASYFLTGEDRAYKKSSGAFDRVKPKSNFGTRPDGTKGWGAWELAARYSYLDLNDGAIKGGELDDVTVGLNWHLNPNVRIMANYVRAMLDDNGSSTGGDSDLFGIRFQVDF
jgi:phosphate-selective porin OprO/OprP